MSASSSSRPGSRSDFSRIWAECPADTVLKLPWEQGFWKDFFDGPSVSKGVRDWKVMEQPLYVQFASHVEQGPVKKPRVTEPVTWQQVVRSGAEQTWQDKREADFQVSLRRWHDTLLTLPCSILVVQQLRALKNTTDRLRMLRDVFWKKAPSTLLKRINSFCRFVDFLKNAELDFPGTEPEFYSFLDSERSAGAPASRIQSIIQSLVFAQHVVGISELSVLTSSRRCAGVSGHRNSGPKRQADPFRVLEIVALHDILADDGRDLWDRCMSGMILLAIYSRSRWNDLQQAETMSLDYDNSGTIAYAELKIADHKTKFSAAFRNCFLHACAPACGVVHGDWIGQWMHVRTLLGVSFDHGHPTMPAPSDGGGISGRPLTSEEMKHWTHLLLRSVEIDFTGRRITSHSCKCTLLSWCAKRGLPWEDRLVLGGHTSTVRSAMVYSRDSLGRPLRLLEKLLMEVRTKAFLPDATRSGRYPGGRTMDQTADVDVASNFSYEPSLVDDSALQTGGVEDASGSFSEALHGGSHEAHPLGRALVCKSEASDLSWSLISGAGVIEVDISSGSETDAVDTTSSSSDEEGAVNNSARRPVQRPRIPDELKLIQHRKLRTLHLMEQQNQRVMLCGRTAEPSRYESVQETRFDTPCCHTCWRKIKEYQ